MFIQFLSIEVLLVILLVGLVVVAGAKIFLQMSAEAETEELLKETFTRQIMDNPTYDESAEQKAEIVQYIDQKLLDKFPWIGEKFVHGGIQTPAAVVTLITLAILVVAAVITLIIVIPKAGIGIALFVGLAVFFGGIGASLFLLDQKVIGHTMAFDEQFGVGLEVLSASMKAGNTFMGSLKFIAESMDPPLGTEFGIISTELSLGVDIQTALDRFQKRLSSKNLFLFCMAVKVASSTGAALAPTFIVLAKVITERFRLQGMINIAIAENQNQMVILALAPWVIVPVLVGLWPDAYHSFIGWIWGQVMMCILFVWYCIGLFCIHKTIRAIDA